MKTIRIIKRAQMRDATELAADESKKPVEPTPRSLADTVKSWIAETEQRKRTQRHSLAALGFLVLIAFTVGMGQTTQQQTSAPPIKVTIATTAGFLGQPNSRFKVGEQIPVSITMTNTSAQQLYTCVSSDLYQDRPRLTRDGKVVPYLNAASYEEHYARRNQVCKQENIPEQVLLEPNKPTVADWLVLVGDGISTQADAWYDSLPAGKYELSIQRQLACCDGPMIESNKISFEVVP
ncbi:MAG TPA: hypothetical protein VJS13_03755 [Pyrinomonadaceae bacterium]|nr:hypothetical protein [Pyrinomonadaceae bacterium]